MKVSLGRIVLVRLADPSGAPRLFNGSDEHPAIVCGCGDGELINARVMVDGPATPLWETSIPRHDLVGAGYTGSTWRWPPTVVG